MNVFYIPSWYPSDSNPIYGIFIKEEIELIAKNHPELNLGISVWGQGDDRFLLWSRKPFSSLIKRLSGLPKPFQEELLPNLVEYNTPQFIWTRKFFKGNLNSIVKANLGNLESFQQQFGKVDIIHVMAGYPGAIIANRISKKYGIPYVITSHMSPFPFDEFLQNGKMATWLETPFKNASKIIATSVFAENVINNHGFKNTTVIPITRDLEYFSLTDIHSNKSKVPQILAVGRLVDQKGFDILLKAISKIDQEFHLTIIGSGAEELALRKLSDRLGVSGNVEFVGELGRAEVREYMQNCDFFVLSSRHETFGNVVLEAAACGKPVVVTKCGGPEDIVKDDIGILVNKEDEGSLKDGIEFMINNMDQYPPEMVRKRVVKRFSSQQVTLKIIDVYKTVLFGDS